jgi:glutamine amidotransferase
LIGIVDYQMGNLASLRNSIARIGFEAATVKRPEDLKDVDRLILPGVGAFGDAAQRLRESGLGEAIGRFVKEGRPLLGVCLGLQLLFESSEESPGAVGLGFFRGTVRRFDSKKAEHSIKIPHMGWNKLIISQNSPLFNGIESGDRLYFVHSYHADCDQKIVTATCFYGYEFACAAQKENVLAIQPHPEKSYTTGLKILKNFALF